MLTKEELIAFERDIADCFNVGQIRAPIHLSGGNEDKLIQYFANGVTPSDWVCGSWRMHYQCLLKGVPPDRLKADILAGKSITLCYPEYQIISSAIVGGILPIATGIAWSLKREWGNYGNYGGEGPWVHCFLGDMTGHTGMFQECVSYAHINFLPITFVVEDNGMSVCTPTADVAGQLEGRENRVYSYTYRLPWPHAGAGKRVQF
jgi:TPP-dependent pyruvate/acetoin dehydrogenase alpha subunit